MVQEHKNLYEGMYIIRPSLSEEARKSAVEKIEKGITRRSGEIVKIHEMGRRKLAYEIEGCRGGYYLLFYFKVHPSAIKELWEEYHMHEDLLRFMTFKTEKVLENLEFQPLVKQ